MLTVWEDALLITAWVVFSLLAMMALNKWWAKNNRQMHNDLTGWLLTVLGTTYAVILGFMLVTVWADYEAARVNVEAEASALVNIHRLAIGLPEGQQRRLQDLARRYADTVVTQEWPEMAEGKVSDASGKISHEMWSTLMSLKGTTATEITAEDHALFELSKLTEHRQIRELQATEALPPILWCVLLIGGVLTMFSTCLFGVENTLLHGVQVFSFALLMALSLVAIADIDRPFQGVVNVDQTPFVRAQMSMTP